MKTETSSLELKYVIEEMQVLINAKVEKIYEQEADKKDILFVFHVMGKGKVMLRILAPKALFLAEKKPSFPTKPPGFCVFLRKYLANARVREVKQRGFERIVEILFEKKEGKYILIIELFAKGNIILCKEDYMILSPLERQDWADRTINARVPYKPPAEKPNLVEISEKEFSNLVIDKDLEIVKVLATELGLGGVYAEETCLMISIDKNKKHVAATEAKKLYSAVQKLLSMKKNPGIVNNEIYPFELSQNKDREVVPAKTFSVALESILYVVEEAPKESTAVIKLKTMIVKQERKVKGFGKEIEENTKKAEAIYSNYNEVKEILNTIRELRDRKVGWDDIKKKLKSNKVFTSLNEKEGKLTVEV